MKHVQYALLFAVAAVFFTQQAAARPWRPGQIPNGTVFGCATCHNTDGSRNAFGRAVQDLVNPGSEDSFWGPMLAALDSDGDGFTNGEELGDPDGDGIPTAGAQVTQPGNASSKPNLPLSITSAAVTQIGFRMAWKDGVAPFLVQQRLAQTGAEWTDVLTTDVLSVVLPRVGEAAFFRVQPSSRKRLLSFTVWMSGATERPEPVLTQGAGLGTLVLQGPILTAHIRFSGLSANASAAHIHGPAGMADVAGVMISLTDVPNSTSGVIESRIDLSGLTAEQLTALRQGRSYVNILTPTHPEGELRGQIAPLLLRASLTGDAVRPDSILTAGTGSGRFWLVGNELTYELDYKALSAAATEAHLHGPADASSSADVLVPFQATDGTLGATGAFSGSTILTPVQLRYVLEGLVYANIHTGNHPGGEVRGQVTP